MKIKIKVQKIKKELRFLKKLFLTICCHFFVFCFFLSFLAFLVAGFLFYKYAFSFIKEKKETTYPTVFLDENLWQEVLQEWQEQEKRFKEADLKQYPNLFNKENIIEEKARGELTD